MMQKKSGRASKLTANDLRAEMIPVVSTAENTQLRIESVNKIFGLMFLNLSKRGRPKKNEWKNHDAA